MKQTIISLLMLLLPLMAHAEAVEIDGIYYNLINKVKQAEVTTNPNGYKGNIVIPSSVVYDDVTYSVTSIGQNAFSWCIVLTSVTIPNSITSIGSSAFYNCSGLASVTIPNSVTSIGQSAFYGCSGLTSITIPNSVTSIGSGAFGGCKGLTSITIPNSVTSIGISAFNDCGSLNAVHITDLEAWCKIDFQSNPLSYAHHLYLNGNEINELVIPNSVTSVGRYAFSGCSGLTSITIPNSVTSIGSGAFGGCNGLTSVVIPNSVTSIEGSAFYNCSGLISVTIPNSVTSIGGGAFSGCSGLTSVTIPNSVTSIGQYAFSGCSGLTSITIPNSVTSIGSQAFYDCNSLKAVSIADLDAWCKIKFTYEDSNPLYYAHHLYLNGNEINELVIPNSITSIGQCAFSGCSGLTSITIPNSITSIGDYAFYGCSGLTFITIPNSVTSIGRYAFSGCSGLTSITIPNSITSIENWTFSNCSGLTSVVIPNSVTSIVNEAFSGCSGLTSITIGRGVKILDKQVFANCPELTDVYCYAEYFQYTNSDIFNGSYIEHATLHVPASALNAYSNTTPWSNFKNIVAIGEQEQIYTLTYMLDGIKYVESNVREGETITPEPAPAKIGYTFSGWSEIPETMPAHDVTITGSFIANKYNLIYKVDDADYKTYELEYGTTITPEPVPTKVGYNFAGWSEIPETMPGHDVTITGIFIPKTYLPGDANGDGQVTVTDIGVIVDIILGKTPANARKQQEVEPE